MLFNFDKTAKFVAHQAGKPMAFTVAVGLILLWIISGPLFGFSDTWQLVINTSTTIITFLMVFIIQNTQNRDTEALQIKMDELIRITGASSALLDVEELSDDELLILRNKYFELARSTKQMKTKRQTEKSEKHEKSRKQKSAKG